MAYVTVRGPGLAEIIIKKSRFVATVGPARSEAEAWGLIEQVRAAHRDATHNCFAFKAGSVQRLSDDGEPSGTAGRPIFDVLEKQGLSDTVVVVTRYFGGVLLGAGGLVRAYSQAAVAGVEAAGLLAAVAAVEVRLTMDYPLVGKVQHVIGQRAVRVLDSRFGVQAEMILRLPQADADALEGGVRDISAGRIQWELLRELLVRPDLKDLHP